MKAISCNGDFFGKFNLITNESTVTVPISSYEAKLYSVLMPSPSGESLVEYSFSPTLSTFSTFDPLSGYLVFAKRPFLLQDFTTPDIIKKVEILGEPLGKYTIFRYPFVTSLPISSYDAFIDEVKTTSSTKSILRTYKPTNYLNPFEYFEYNKTYLVKAKNSFTINSPDSTVRADMTVGAITGGQVVPGTYSVEQFAEALITRIFEPTFVAPSMYLTSNLPSIVESGTVGVIVTSTLNRGQIVGALVNDVWSVSAIQDFRCGPATSYSTTINTTTLTANPANFTASVIQDGANTFTGTINFEDGPQPRNNRNKPYSTPFESSFVINYLTIMGRRRAFYGVDNAATSSAEIRSLANSYLNPSNGTTFAITIPAGSVNVVFAYPSGLRNVNSVKYVEGLNAEVKEIFTQTTVQVEGLSGYTPTEYKVYKYTPAVPFSQTVTYNVTI
jgi:hypothetical protein